MPVPKRKLSKSRRDMRSASKFIRPQAVMLCPNEVCGAPKLPHEVCSKCGFYRGKKVIKTKMDRSVVRAETRAQKAKTAGAQAAQGDQQ